MKHTPGPWISNEQMVYSEIGSGETIANINTEANARLIAVAPELLAELTYIDYAIGTGLKRDLNNDDIIEISITVKAARDIRSLINQLITE